MRWTKEGERALLLLIIWAGAALRVHQLGAKGFWGDEIWTAQRSSWPAGQIISFSLENTVGPWTYLAGRAALTLLGAGHLEFILRWPSALAGILTIPLIWALARRLWGRPAGLLAAAMLALSPYQVWYAQEARYYTWMVLFSIASFYFLYRAFQQPRRWGLWAGFSIATILNIYNHPLSALLVVIGQLLFCLIYGFRRSQRPARLAGLAGSCLAIGLACLPLVLRTLAVGQINTQEASTVFSPTLEDWLAALIAILSTMVERFGAEGWARWPFLALALLGILAAALARQWRQLALLAPPLLLVPLFFAISKYPFILRYLLFLQPLYLALVARGAIALVDLGAWLADSAHARGQNSQHKLWRIGLGSALAGAAVVFLILASLVTTARAYAQSKPIDWRSLAAYLQTHAQPQDAIVSRFPWGGTALHWYLDPSTQFTLFDATETAAIQSGTRRIWLIEAIERPLDPTNDQDPLAQLNLIADEGWKDPRLNYEDSFFPISELPARLYVGQIDNNWIKFAGIPEPNWTDRPYSEIAPGGTLHFSLTMPADAPRELWVTYFDYPDKELRVSIEGQVVGVIGGMGGDWQTAHLPVPPGLGDVVNVTIDAVGADSGGVSYAELRAATP